jgi:hypothetical protein
MTKDFTLPGFAKALPRQTRTSGCMEVNCHPAEYILTGLADGEKISNPSLISLFQREKKKGKRAVIKTFF